MSSSADSYARAGAANQMMRKLLHELESLTTLVARDTGEISELRESVRTQLAEREREVRQAAEEFRPPDLGGKLRVELSSVFTPPEPHLTEPPPASLKAAREEWKRIISDPTLGPEHWPPVVSQLESVVSDLVQAQRNWSTKLIKRRRSEPVVPDRVWSAIERLTVIYSALPSVREQFVAEERTAAAYLNEDLAAEIQRRDEARRETFAASRAMLEQAEQAAGILGAPWSDARWDGIEPARHRQRFIRIGELATGLPTEARIPSIPAMLEFPFTSGIAVVAEVQQRPAAIDLVRSMVLRVLAATPPGEVRFVFVDPVALGQSVAEFRHLSEFDQRLVDVKTWTSERDIEARLVDLSDHLEVVISNYLRGQFDSIDAYNEEADEVAEPYRVLVVLDYPAGFSDAATRQLLSIIENGPRCGVHTILHHDPAQARVDRLIHSMQKVQLSGSASQLSLAEPIGTIDLRFIPDATPPIAFAGDGRATSAAGRLLLGVGAGSRSTQSGPVTLERLLPIVNRQIASGRVERVPEVQTGAPEIDHADFRTWWSGVTSRAAFAPIGRAGAKDVAALYFSSTEVAGGAIMVGLPRSGKSTALHAAIVSMAMIYPPEELELYLVDSKHGVEFKIYERLPHARLVSVHSEREFSVSVLESLDSEIRRRAELMKRHAAGKANLTEYRAATGERLSRIVLVMDEFHELFEEDDALGQTAFQAFSNIVRQGPFAGVHVVLSSQTLSSMPAMDRSTLSLLPMRIAFMCNELDADLVMGDSNREVKALNQQGEGIFNPVRGDPAHNKPFRGLYIPPDERDALLASLEIRADQSGWERIPRVFDGDQLAARSGERADGSPTRPVFAIGEPFTLAARAELALRRGRGANVLLLGTGLDNDQPDSAVEGALHSCLADAAAQQLTAVLVDFVGDDDTLESGLDLLTLCEALKISYARGSALRESAHRVAAEIDRRRADGAYRETGGLLVLHGLQRALDLSPADPFESGDGPEQSSAELIARIVRDGPEVGWHTLVTVDALVQLERRLGGDLLREFDWRIAGSMVSTTDIAAITDYTEGQVRVSQLLIADHAKAKSMRVRAYPRHTHESLASSTDRSKP